MGRGPIRVSVEGLDRLAAKLDELPPEMLRGAASAVAATTDAVADLMRESAPVDTGELRDSVEGQAAGLHGEVRVTASHGVHVEYGTSRTPEQPFATPSAERGRRILPDEVKRHVRQELPA